MNGKLKLLIAYDGSGGADAALEDLRRAGFPRQAEAVVISVAELWLWPLSSDKVEASAEKLHITGLEKAPEPEAQALEKTHALALEAGQRLQAHFPNWKVRAEADAGSPASVVLDKADEWKPDLVVIGSQGRSALGRFFLGSVSQKVVTEANCSVRVGRGRAEPRDSAVRIIIGVDNSPGAEAAVRAVAARLWPTGSEARLIAVANPLRPEMVRRLTPLVAELIKRRNEEMWEWVQKVVIASAQKLDAVGLAVSHVIKEGDPKRVLLDEAEAWGPDSIFVGATSLSRRDRFLLGSVSSAMAMRAPCSVEVVRTQETK